MALLSFWYIYWRLCAAGLLVPAIAWMLGSRLSRAATRESADHLPRLWFAHLRISAWLLTASIFVWVPTSVNLIIRTNLPDESFFRVAALIAPLCFGPPVLAEFFYQLASRDLVEQVRRTRWTAREIAGQVFWKLIAGMFPFVALGIAIFTATISEYRAAAIAAGLAIWAFLLGSGRQWKANGITFRDLATGELRDRTFELAQRAGVKLRSLALMRSERGLLMNAFAALGGGVLIAEDLVQALPRDEVDAILAHELGHLKHRHAIGLLAAAVIPVVLIAWLLGKVPVSWVSDNSILLAVPFGVLIALAASRRAEREADRAAVALVENPAAAIRALAHLTQLNLLPSRWSGWDVKVISHPSLDDRARLIAAHFGIPEAEAQSLLAVPLAAGDSYPLPETAEVNLLAAYSQRVGVRNLLVYVACTAVPTALAVLMLPLLPPWVCWPVAAVAAYAAGQVVPWSIRRSDFRRLETEFRAQTGQTEGEFVGLSPIPCDALYNGLPFWDMGVVTTGSGCLRYEGEQTSFALAAGIAEPKRVRPSPGWFGPEAVTIAGVRLVPLNSDALYGTVARWLEPQSTAQACEPAPAFPAITHLKARDVLFSTGFFMLVLLSAAASALATAVLTSEWTALPSLLASAVVIADAAWSRLSYRGA